MANAYSSPQNYGKPVSTTDISQLTVSVQGAMQQTYNSNLSKVDSLIQQYTSTPLVRPEDREYLGERLKTLVSSIDQNSKINWTSGLATRDVNSHISAAIDDNVLKQMANSQKIINFEQTSAQKKAKGDGTYDDSNYVYAKDKAGYEAYMRGETDDIGNLQYVDYYDVNKNLTQEVEKYAKDRGYEKVISENKEGFIYQTVKGKKVTPDEIANYVQTLIGTNPKLQQQLLINSHTQYRGATDEQVLSEYSNFAKKEASVYEDKIKSVENELKNINPDYKDKIAEKEKEKTALSEQRNSILSKATPENFNRDAVQYTSYTKDLVNKYAKTYSFEDITDIKYDDFFIKLAKAEGRLTSEGTPTEGGLGTAVAGQLYQQDRGASKETEIDDMTRFESDKAVAWNETVALMKQKLIAEGKEPTTKNLTNYYAGIKNAAKSGFDINASQYSGDVIAMYQKVTELNKRNFSYTKIAKEQYGNVTQETLSGLFGGKTKDLNVEGLAETMPFTATMLKKYSSADQMSKIEKAKALHEVATNAKNTLVEDPTAKKQIQFYISSLERDNSFSKEDLKQNVESGEQPGFWGSAGDILAGTGSRLLQGFQNVGATFLVDPFRRPEARRQAVEEAQQQAAKTQEGISRAYSNLGRSITTDRNLSELQSGDVGLGSYQSPRDLYSAAAKNTKSRMEAESLKYRANAPTQFSMILNPDIKADKPYVNLVKNALYANGAKPTDDTYINIAEIKGDKAVIKFEATTDVPTATEGVTKKYTQEKEILIPLSSLPSNLLKNLKLDNASFSFSVKNPNPMSVSYKYAPPETMDSRREFAQRYLENNFDYMSEEQVRMLQTNGMPDVKTKEEYAKAASILPAEYFNAFKAEVQSEYNLTWERPQGGGVFIGRLSKNGSSIKENIQLGEDFNPHLYQLYSMREVSRHLDEKLSELTTAYNRTKY